MGQHVTIQGCFYHLSQSTWRKIQELGLSTAYRDNAEFNHFSGMVDSLALLPVAEVADGMTFLRSSMPTGDGLERISELVDYFESTYVSGTVRNIKRPTNSQCIPPLFPPAVWNVQHDNISGNSRTNNFCESRITASRCWWAYVTRQSGSFYEHFQEDEAMVTTVILQTACGQLPTKRVKCRNVQVQARLLPGLLQRCEIHCRHG